MSDSFRFGLACTLLLSLCTSAAATEYFVATDGSDANSGAKDAPFRTISKAAAVMEPGDGCIVRAGTYRETVQPRRSGKKGNPIRFVAAKGEEVILDGTDPVTSSWALHEAEIYKTRFTGQSFEQMFVDREMMVEARWPNMTLKQRFDRASWAPSGEGSGQDLMICAELAGTGIDWTGALATLNVAHQFKTWTRTVEKHEKGSDRFTYSLDERLSDGKSTTGRAWHDDYFFLSGKLEALDAPGEWFLDAEQDVLYLQTDDGKSPQGQLVEVKARDYAFDLRNREHIEISGFRFFATTFRLVNCNHCVVEDCRLAFPTYSRRLTEADPKGRSSPSPATSISGSHNVVRRVGLAFSNTYGLKVNGEGNLVENCIVRDVNWSGSIFYGGITSQSARAATVGNRIARCTVTRVGNIGIYYRGPHDIGYNHVSETGLTCKDIATVHTGGSGATGCVVHHNWIHGSTGKGLRGDDQTRGLTFHHNVVWDCEDVGIIMKGDNNRVFNNTLVGPSRAGALLIPTRREPEKWWTRDPILDVQNANSLFCNNLVVDIEYRRNPLPESDRISHNILTKEDGVASLLVSVEKHDYRPKKGSIVIDAGRAIKNASGGHRGAAPDVGAYEYGGENWQAGADWKMK